MYSVLGSQASTRWAIVDEGAKSLQTQVVFRKVVNASIIEDDQTITINDMGKAIVDTKVILNAAITPGIILIPASLIILKKKIPGYNNILTLGDYWMKFRENPTVNKIVVPVKKSSPVKKKSPVKQKSPVQQKSPVKKDDVRSTGSSDNKPVHNPFKYRNNSGLASFAGKNDGGNIQRNSSQSSVGTGDNTHKLMALYGVSTVVGFAGLKIVSMII